VLQLASHLLSVDEEEAALSLYVGTTGISKAHYVLYFFLKKIKEMIKI
jgi:hypothetical protein